LHQADASSRPRFHALIDQILGVDFPQPFQRKGGTGAVAQQTFQAIARVGPDTFQGIDREAAAVLPLGHHPRVLRRQQSAPQGRALQSPEPSPGGLVQ